MPHQRKSIPKQIKDQVWDTYFGKDKGVALCFCCNKKELRQSSFHAGHVVASVNGGSDTVDNLRPICGSCNRSMGTMNLNEYIDRYRPSGDVAPMDLDKKSETIEEVYDNILDKCKTHEEKIGAWGMLQGRQYPNGTAMPQVRITKKCKCGKTIMEIVNTVQVPGVFSLSPSKSIKIPKDGNLTEMAQIVKDHRAHMKC